MKTKLFGTMVALTLLAMGCRQPDRNSLGGRVIDADEEEQPEGPTRGTKKKDAGAGSGEGTAPDAQAPPRDLDPNGFTSKIAPLLDAQGCTECHHEGRPIDLTRYPFALGDEKAAADKLIASFAQTMPPAPREKATAATVEAVTAWRASGMKP